MIDGSLIIPYGEIPLEERQRHQQAEIAINRERRQLYQEEHGPIEARRITLFRGMGMIGIVQYQQEVVERFDCNEG